MNELFAIPLSHIFRDEPESNLEVMAVPDYNEVDCQSCAGVGWGEDGQCPDCLGLGIQLEIYAVTIYPKGDPRGDSGELEDLDDLE